MAPIYNEQLYHVSPTRNIPSITNIGVCPEFARGDRKRSYFVTVGNLAWAVLHVHKRHSVAIEDISICIMQRGANVFYTPMFGGRWFHSEVPQYVQYHLSVWDYMKEESKS